MQLRHREWTPERVPASPKLSPENTGRSAKNSQLPAVTPPGSWLRQEERASSPKESKVASSGLLCQPNCNSLRFVSLCCCHFPVLTWYVSLKHHLWPLSPRLTNLCSKAVLALQSKRCQHREPSPSPSHWGSHCGRDRRTSRATRRRGPNVVCRTFCPRNNVCNDGAVVTLVRFHPLFPLQIKYTFRGCFWELALLYNTGFQGKINHEF